MSHDEKITIRLPALLRKEIKRLAREYRWSEAEVIRYAVERLVEGE